MLLTRHTHSYSITCHVSYSQHVTRTSHPFARCAVVSLGGAPVLDWPDLLQPRLKGRLAVIDASHEFVAIALKSLGLSANTRASQLSAAGVSYSMLQQRVAALWAQTRLFSSRDHIRALQAGDVWAVVGWSSDLVGVAERSNNISVIAPASGATLWADLWTVPAGAKGGHRQSGPSPLLPSWIEFALQPARIPSLPGLKTGASPLLLPDLPPPAAPSPSPPLQPSSSGFRLFGRGGRQHASSSSSKAADAGQVPAASASASGSGGVTATPADVRLRPGQYYMPPAPLLQRSEFLLPLDDDTRELYRKLLESLNK